MFNPHPPHVYKIMKGRDKMGHIHPENLSKLAINYIYTKGKISINQLIEHAKNRGEVVHCSEGTYVEDYMYAIAFHHIIHFHYDSKFCFPKAYCLGIQTIEPILLTIEDRIVFKKWKNDDLESNEDWEVFMNIQWKFVKGGRKRFIDGEVQHLKGITL